MFLYLLDPGILSIPKNQRQVMAIGEIIQELLQETTQKNKHENSESLVKKKSRISAKYCLDSPPRLTDIIAAVPVEQRKFIYPKIKAKPVRTASGVLGILDLIIK